MKKTNLIIGIFMAVLAVPFFSSASFPSTYTTSTPLTFSSLNVSSGTSTNFILIPTSTTYTFQNIFFQTEATGTVVSLECPAGNVIAHQKSPSANSFSTEFLNLNASVSAGTSSIQCVFNRTAGASEQTFIQAQYYPFNIFTTSTSTDIISATTEDLKNQSFTNLAIQIFYMMDAVFFIVAMWFSWKGIKKLLHIK